MSAGLLPHPSLAGPAADVARCPLAPGPFQSIAGALFSSFRHHRPLLHRRNSSLPLPPNVRNWPAMQTVPNPPRQPWNNNDDAPPSPLPSAITEPTLNFRANLDTRTPDAARQHVSLTRRPADQDVLPAGDGGRVRPTRQVGRLLSRSAAFLLLPPPPPKASLATTIGEATPRLITERPSGDLAQERRRDGVPGV